MWNHRDMEKIRKKWEKLISKGKRLIVLDLIHTHVRHARPFCMRSVMFMPIPKKY